MSKVIVVGIGPGEYEQMTIKAANALKECDVIVGYTVYIDLVRDHFPGKTFLTTPMTREVERCEMAFEEAKKGQTVAMICSGDAGVYGMSGLIYEVSVKYPGVEVEVLPGVTAVSYTHLCTGMGAMMIAQTLENIGMCLGLTPVIGLTLPFFSYGGTSIAVSYTHLEFTRRRYRNHVSTTG